MRMPFWISLTLRWGGWDFWVTKSAPGTGFSPLEHVSVCIRLRVQPSLSAAFLGAPLGIRMLRSGFSVKVLLQIKFQTFIFLQSHIYSAQRSVLMGIINTISNDSMAWIWKAWVPIISFVSSDFIDSALADGYFFSDIWYVTVWKC